MERGELVSVKRDKRHRKVRVIGDFANLIDQVDFVFEAVKVWELELGDSEEVSGFLHCLLQLLELLPKVIKLTPIC